MDSYLAVPDNNSSMSINTIKKTLFPVISVGLKSTKDMLQQQHAVLQTCWQCPYTVVVLTTDKF